MRMEDDRCHCQVEISSCIGTLVWGVCGNFLLLCSSHVYPCKLKMAYLTQKLFPLHKKDYHISS